ncbi:MAG: exodeoxyribonuclease VII large subunit, partial [Bacteroidaceae bacterium]|nr:exodeoxyribonuclease VII large subunit [Bacteroidaceae bacterium]
MGNVLTLYQLNSLVRELLEGSFTDSYWVTAELSEVRESVKGHCFLELMEQGERGGAP